MFVLGGVKWTVAVLKMNPVHIKQMFKLEMSSCYNMTPRVLVFYGERKQLMTWEWLCIAYIVYH